MNRKKLAMQAATAANTNACIAQLEHTAREHSQYGTSLRTYLVCSIISLPYAVVLEEISKQGIFPTVAPVKPYTLLALTCKHWLHLAHSDNRGCTTLYVRQPELHMCQLLHICMYTTKDTCDTFAADNRGKKMLVEAFLYT